MDMDIPKQIIVVSYLNPFIRIETHVKAADYAHIKIVNEKSLNYIEFNREELEDFLTQMRGRMESNISHPFKFRNLFKKDFNIKPKFPKKVLISNRSKSFKFDEESLNKLFEIEKSLYEFIKANHEMMNMGMQ